MLVDDLLDFLYAPPFHFSIVRSVLLLHTNLSLPLQGVTAASSGTHTHAGAESRRLAWRCLARPSAGCGGYRRGAAEIPAGSP